MTFWSLDRVAAALAPVRAGPSPRGPATLHGVSTDTRSLAEGDVFVALRGERFDAHEFTQDAVTRGAAALVLADPSRGTGLGRPVFGVTDTTAALGALGAYRRRAWNGTVVAIAGSNGKTTTKALVQASLESLFAVHASTGNLNNQVGVPLTLLAIPDAADVAVIEIGTNHPGEVEALRRLVAPDIAVVTSIGEEHLEGLGDLAGVLREETSVFRDARVAIAPASQPEVAAAAHALAASVVSAGLDAGDVRPERWGIDQDGCGWLEVGETRCRLTLRGVHNLRNAMLAVAVARACGVPLASALERMAHVTPVSMRGTWQEVGARTLINDAYNANPASMREAIALLDGLATARQRVLVLGSMRELGARTAALHDDVAGCALSSRADLIAGIGDMAEALSRATPRDGRVVTAPDVEELWPALRARLAPDAVVLIKASRGVRLERLVPHLEADRERAS